MSTKTKTRTTKPKIRKNATAAPPAPVVEPTDYDALSQWAENEMTLPQNSTTALRGEDAAAAGRALLERVTGRPRLDPTDDHGGPSPKRQVRLPAAVSRRVDAIAAAQNRKPSEVMRDAITAYIDTTSRTGL